jgi:guanine nucleotide-binding protein subunit alpha
MGACISQPDRASKSRSDEIDRQLEEDSKRYKKECKILLLGSGESGKSTIVKQMKIIHQEGFTPAELLAFRPTIHKNAVDSAQAVVRALRECKLEVLLEEGHRHLPEAIMGVNPEAMLSAETADAIEVLWRDPVVARVLDEHQSEFYLMDSAA